MRYIYTGLLYLAMPFILLRLLWQSRKSSEYAIRWNERFGCFSVPDQPTELWVHAVSLGEVIAAEPLIKRLLDKYPDKKITVTTMTPTGSQRVANTFGENIFHVYIPYDYPDAIARFIKRVQPKLAIIMETELWPNLLHQCQLHQIKVLIANARLSERSAKGYAKISSLTQEMFDNIIKIAAQSDADAHRFESLGMPRDKINVVGNVKFDISIADTVITEGVKLRERCGVKRHVWVAASTHDGEEQKVLAAHQQIRQHIPDALLILVPRHPERFDAVEDMSNKQGFITARRTDDDYPQDMQVLIGNTMGEMLVFFAAADIAFVAGSFKPIGGHNVLEPAALSKPVLSGPYMFNFAKIEHLLKSAQGLLTVHDQEDLAKQVIELFQHPEQRETLGKNAHKVLEQNRGAVDAHMHIINQLID